MATFSGETCDKDRVALAAAPASGAGDWGSPDDAAISFPPLPVIVPSPGPVDATETWKVTAGVETNSEAKIGVQSRPPPPRTRVPPRPLHMPARPTMGNTAKPPTKPVFTTADDRGSANSRLGGPRDEPSTANGDEPVRSRDEAPPPAAGPGVKTGRSSRSSSYGEDLQQVDLNTASGGVLSRRTACLINPNKPFRILWESLGIVMVVWVTLSLPFKLAFLTESINDQDPLFIFQVRAAQLADGRADTSCLRQPRRLTAAAKDA